MYYIKLDEDMSLVKTEIDTIYLGDNLSKKLVFLLPETIGDDEIDTIACYVYLQYIRADGTANIVLLKRLDEMYENLFYQYVFPVTTELTKYAGNIQCQLQIYADVQDGTAIATSGKTNITVSESMNLDYYMPNLVTYAFHQMKSQMDAQISETNGHVSNLQEAMEAANENIDSLQESVEILTSAKADSLTYDTNTGVLQLTANGEAVGDPVTINVKGGRSIASVSLTTEGELIIFFTDGTFTNLGSVRGADGQVYVPHINDSVLSFTIEDAAGEIPEPIDLNPNDDWSEDTPDDYSTDYTWDNDSDIDIDDTGG